MYYPEGFVTLGELITELKKLPPEQKLNFALYYPHSYRGYYKELAFEPCVDAVTVGELLADAERANGTTFCGWKGGDFLMTEETTVWIAFEGNLGQPLTDLALRFILQNPDTRG